MWQAYLDLLLQDTRVQSAGIFGQDGPVWAASPTLMLGPTEVVNLVAGMKDIDKLQTGGIVAAGAKYVYVSYNTFPVPIVWGRKDPATLLAALSNRAVIVVLNKDGTRPASITSHVMVALKLIEAGH